MKRGNYKTKKVSLFEKDIDSFRYTVKISRSIDEVGKRMGYKRSGGFYKFFKRMAKKHNVDYSHFSGQSWSRGKDRRKKLSETDVNKVFRNGSDIRGYSLLRRLIIDLGRPYVCEKCGVSVWQGNPLRLQVDHINGVNIDNRKENLIILCPNCHSQTTTYSRGLRKINANSWTNTWWKKMVS